MTDPGAPIRRCPECGEEFQPHVVHCSDCGALLESAFEGEAAPEARASTPATVEPAPRQYVVLERGLTSGLAQEAAQYLGAAGIPFRVAAEAGGGFRVSVPLEQMEQGRAALEDAGVGPEPADLPEGAVAAEGGPCPACGDDVAPGTDECPGCGLQLAGAFQCARCGAELQPFEACTACAPEPD